MKIALIMVLLLQNGEEVRMGIMRSETSCQLVAASLNAGEKTRAERDKVQPLFYWKCGQ